MIYGEQKYGNLQHEECLEMLREGKHPVDPETMARSLQAIVWRQDQLEAKLDQLATEVCSKLRLSP